MTTSRARRASGLAAALAALLLATAPAAEPITVKTRAVALNPEAPTERRVGQLEYLAGFVLNADNAHFGGLSGLILGGDGRDLIAVSDKGRWLTARLVLAPDGRLTGLADAALTPILGPNGQPMPAGHGLRDAEAVLRLADGSLAVSFERSHRLWRYASPAAPAEPMVFFKALRAQPSNGGVEAATALADGRLLLLSEEGRDDQGDHQGWIWQSGQAAALSYAGATLFKPTDLARLPNGDVLVLERRFSPLGGAGGRLSRVAKATIEPGARLEGRELARLEWPRIADNFEGLAVAPAADGGTLVYLLSDDNFNAFQDTLLLQFRLLPD